MKPIASMLALAALVVLPACSSPPAKRPQYYPKAESHPAAQAYKAGQRWTYRRVDLWRNEETERFRQEFAFEEAGRWMVRWTILDSDDPARRGSVTGELFDPASHGFADRRVSGRYEPLRFPLVAGKSWTFDYALRDGGRATTIRQTATVVGWDTVRVPAGSFHALKVEHQGSYTAAESGFSWSGKISETFWYAPSIGRVVLREYRDTKGDGGTWDQWRDELVETSVTGKNSM